MNNKPITALFLTLSIAAFVACSDSSSSESIESMRLDAENAFRKGDYKGSYEICEKIVKKDSTVSFGYFGMAKAALSWKDINSLEMIKLLGTGDDEIPYTKEDAYTQTKYLQGMKMVAAAFSELNRRDSLTRLNPKNKPLSDLEYGRDYFESILFAASTIKGIVELYDTNEDGCIMKKDDKYDDGKPKDWAKLGCEGKELDICVDLKKGENEEGFVIELCNISEDLDDPDFFALQMNSPFMELRGAAKQLNEKVNGFGGDMDDVAKIMESLGIGKESGSWAGDVDSYKGHSVFYRVGTHIDEDGDGCIDEDIMDGQDNDGDGLKNGNARYASVNTDFEHYADDGFCKPGEYNHSMSGDCDDDKPITDTPDKIKPICNNPGCTVRAALEPDSLTGKVTVLKFTQKPGYWTTNDRDLKLMIAQDTACPPEYDLQYRINNIGGCWPNYNPDKFVKYWLKRELAREGHKDRVHPSCKDCVGAACLVE